MERLTYIARERGRLSVSGAPGGYDAYLAAEAAARRKGLVLFVAADDAHAVAAADAMRFFAKDVAVLPFPAWDCLPYDRTSPKSDIESQRLATLAALARATRIAHRRLSSPPSMLCSSVCRRRARSPRPASLPVSATMWSMRCSPPSW
jgi:transcription-repair coupling factor (superfamily II helicase)